MGQERIKSSAKIYIVFFFLDFSLIVAFLCVFHKNS